MNQYIINSTIKQIKSMKLPDSVCLFVFYYRYQLMIRKRRKTALPIESVTLKSIMSRWVSEVSLKQNETPSILYSFTETSC